MNPVTFNCTVLRDGHQSLAATRMKTADMLPIAPILDSMGFSALETWGGATIDAGLRFLKEWPFDRLDALKKAAPKTPHMMLLRGQNIVGYTNYADDVVEAFVAMSAKHGMNIFRIFDCVNDPRNMETSIRAAKKAGAQAHGTIATRLLPCTPRRLLWTWGGNWRTWGRTPSSSRIWPASFLRMSPRNSSAP